jgi:hypothetical protein
MGEFWASPEQSTWLGWIPIPALIVAADGSALAVNPAWAAVLPVTPEGDGWVEAVEPAFRSMLRARLRLAVAAGEPGGLDCRVSGRRGSRWSRWWWHPAHDELVQQLLALPRCRPGRVVPRSVPARWKS